MIFKATEFIRDTLEPTGRIEYYHAAGIRNAVNHVLYVRQLTNGAAMIGPTNRVVYSGPFAYAVTPNN
jgi:hypothetical protein